MTSSDRSPLHTPLCDELGATHAIFGFTHSLDAAIAISRNGGIGIWGATRSTPEEIEVGLTRMDSELGDLPYGIDLVIPPGMPERDNRDEIEAAIPDGHRAFVAGLREHKSQLHVMSDDPTNSTQWERRVGREWYAIAWPECERDPVMLTDLFEGLN